MNNFLKSLWAEEKKVLSKNSDLVRLIQRIPHLELDLDLDLNLLKKESETVATFYPHKLHPNKVLPPEYYSHHEFSFQGVCLTDFVNDSVRGMSDSPGFLCQEPDAQFDDYRTKFFITPAGQKMPYIMGKLKEISPYFNRTRLMKTPPRGGIPWHSHHNNVYKINHLRLCIMNIPIETNSNCQHGVRSYCKENQVEYWKHYKPGKAYLFNSWHDHSFWNKGETDRLTIIPYFNFSDQKLLDFLAKNIEKYDGPLLNIS